MCLPFSGSHGHITAELATPTIVAEIALLLAPDTTSHAALRSCSQPYELTLLGAGYLSARKWHRAHCCRLMCCCIGSTVGLQQQEPSGVP